MLLLFAGQLFQPILTFAQTAEWRLVLKNYNNTDPDGVGPATGSVQFALEMHAVAGTIAVREISVGYSYQSTKAMVPTTPGCVPTSNPANITISPEFAAGGYTYATVNQCNVLVTNAGGQVFDRTAAGSLEQGSGSGITLTTTWVPALNITLWTLNPLAPEGGFALLHSSENGTPGPLGSYSVADASGNSVPTNSLSYSTPLSLSSAAMPVTLSNFDITCNTKGVKLNWQTLTEQNSSHFEVERSSNGANGWTVVGTSKALGNSNAAKNYEFIDLKGGSAFYRLRQVDKDGKFTYTGVRRINCQSKQANLFVYPVPAKNVLNIVVATEKNSKATILLADVAGKVVRQVQTQLQSGSNNIRLDVSGLARGEYFLKVLGSDNLQTQKVSIID